jgi:hypothetical protein
MRCSATEKSRNRLGMTNAKVRRLPMALDYFSFILRATSKSGLYSLTHPPSSDPSLISIHSPSTSRPESVPLASKSRKSRNEARETNTEGMKMPSVSVRQHDVQRRSTAVCRAVGQFEGINGRRQSDETMVKVDDVTPSRNERPKVPDPVRTT